MDEIPDTKVRINQELLIHCNVLLLSNIYQVGRFPNFDCLALYVYDK